MKPSLFYKITRNTSLIATIGVVCACQNTKNTVVHQTPIPQVSIARVDSMADIPQPLQIIDYRTLAQKFDSTVYDFNATGPYWPLIWMDNSRRNFDQPTVGIYTAMGDVRQGAAHHDGIFHEAVASMGAVLGASLVGIDKTQQAHNYVAMLKNYFNKDTGWDIMMNNTSPEVAALGGGYGRDWWYDVFPNVLFYGIYAQYPKEPGLDSLARRIADKFYQADSVLNGDYGYSFFDYAHLQPKKNNICAQPDAAAGHAYVLYAAYQRFKDPKYLKGAQRAMDALVAQPRNPSYEVLMPFGAYMAARINAEQGTDYDITKMLQWSMDGTAECREGWGFLVGRWNGFDISGIVGSTVDHGGYGFLMNTYDAAWPLVPLVRYNPAYAQAIGKWMLNAANATRLFYPQYMPAEHQTLPHQADITKDVIGYEGMVQKATYPQYEHIKAPVAQGDGPKWIEGNPDISQFSVYGSAHVGIFGSIIDTTNTAGILRLNLLATDFFRDRAYPSFLYYNPYPESKEVRIWTEDAGIEGADAEAVDLYDAVSGTFVARNIRNGHTIRLAAQTAAVWVLTPANATITYKDGKTLADGVVIDYQRGTSD